MKEKVKIMEIKANILPVFSIIYKGNNPILFYTKVTNNLVKNPIAVLSTLIDRYSMLSA